MLRQMLTYSTVIAILATTGIGTTAAFADTPGGCYRVLTREGTLVCCARTWSKEVYCILQPSTIRR